MVFAKTSKAASRLSDQVRRNAMERTYLAVVNEKPKQASIRLVNYLYKNRQKNKVSIVSEHHKEGKKAVLDYSVIASRDGLSLLSVKLQTGRPHQIRVQLAGIGTSIWGDQKYGAQYSKVGQQIALWANSLTLTHPVQKTPITVESPLPEAYPWNIW